MKDNNWTSDLHHSGETGSSTMEQYKRTQKNKIGKALIGIAVLIVVGFVMWQAGPAPHSETINHAAVYLPAKAPPAPTTSAN